MQVERMPGVEAPAGALRNGAADRATRFPQALLNVGFAFALVLAGACLLGSFWYLFSFLNAANTAVERLLTAAAEHPETSRPTVLYLSIVAKTGMTKYALLSCGVSVGMAFGFLGFALFLIGIKGEMDVEAKSEQYSLKLARLAPGVFVIFCAAVLIGVCVTQKVEYSVPQLDQNQARVTDSGTAQGFEKSMQPGGEAHKGEPRNGEQSISPAKPSAPQTGKSSSFTRDMNKR